MYRIIFNGLRFLLILFLLVVISCNNATEPSDEVSTGWYPMDLENSWTYKENGKYYTSTVVETDINMPFADNLALMIQETSNPYTDYDSLYWENTEDYLQYWYIVNYPEPDVICITMLAFPLYVGKTWVAHEDHVYECMSLDTTITVPAGTFENCVRIDQRGNEDDSFIYFAQGVGYLGWNNKVLEPLVAPLTSFSVN